MGGNMVRSMPYGYLGEKWEQKREMEFSRKKEI